MFTMPLKLRKDEKRTWSKVTRTISERYPGRSPGPIPSILEFNSEKAGHFDGRPGRARTDLGWLDGI
ncbi:hypothetical protein BO71DRAFT_26468 [Aspergillus ellipticus CBS 707.79]|uniref:Uncharacterized protein n=1 Tax=Aspergillus ellipticus CBS 707.79 TaxID=1448320 RepID=A0A319D4K5_9EURO|nr:hypothetical protein BO71DRAFT_26468 [Aspergillus ellipticus CBS 707.79]